MDKLSKITDVTAGWGGKTFLLAGRDKTALIDTGMACFAPALIAGLKERLAGRPLDYILASHSHYDHIGAVPYLRREWPAVKVLGADHAAYVLTRRSALETIRALGGLGVKILATPGHTRCSLSFLAGGGTLFASETTVYMSGGRVYPAFITSSVAALAAIEKCRRLNPAVIVPPHHGPIGDRARATYWDDCEAALRDAVAFILAHARQGHGEKEILAAYERDMRDEGSRREQPLAAFRLNTQAMIRIVLRENGLSRPGA
jgi:glyoxylase-like metal-dependent hydrolase (beta-lactamase superfamily II)